MIGGLPDERTGSLRGRPPCSCRSTIGRRGQGHSRQSRCDAGLCASGKGPRVNRERKGYPTACRAPSRRNDGAAAEGAPSQSKSAEGTSGCDRVGIAAGGGCVVTGRPVVSRFDHERERVKQALKDAEESIFHLFVLDRYFAHINRDFSRGLLDGHRSALEEALPKLRDIHGILDAIIKDIEDEKRAAQENRDRKSVV